MKSLFLIFFLFVLSTQSFGQGYDFKQYDRYRELAEINKSSGDFKVSLLYADSMLMTFEYYPFDYFESFITAWNLKEYSKAKEYLVRGTLKGLEISDWNSEELSSFLTTDDGKLYLIVKDSLLIEHYNTLDTVSFNLISMLFKNDQSIRDGSKMMVYNDSLTFETLIKLSEERGFPTFPKVGIGCNKAAMMLWHHRGKEYPSSEQWQRIIPLINKEIENGMLDPNFFDSFDNFK